MSGEFGPDFVWGAASSAYQVEGAVDVDGRGRSIWDTFVDEPGRVLDGTTAASATEAYTRVDEDVAVMKRLGLKAYRFSVSWSRVDPDGDGRANQRGLDYYRRLVDALLEAGIAPWITLYHWDLPQALEDAGGWPERDTARRFADYAALTYEALSDRVGTWITVNEPWCAAFVGYASGEHAPGRREPAAAVRAAHHLLLGHGLAVGALRSLDPGPRLAIGLNLYPVRAVGDDAADAARRIDGAQNRLFADPVLKGRYPSDVLDDLAPVTDFGHIRDGDLETISRPIDLLCVNYYSPYYVTARSDGAASVSAAPTGAGSPWPGNDHVGFVRGSAEQTSMGWDIEPDGLRETLVRLGRDYPGIPLAVSENGAAFDDVRDGDRVRDTRRRDYLAAHIDACARAVAEGAPLEGYFAWSLMDNFEWAWGLSKRFGLVYVDFDTQERLVKDSGRWYAEMIARSTGARPAE
ncbi:MAG TPA: GH1 family beta-glucosidase [Stackebrandtia sp.]|jgi:beta-glucosidase|uniref:GH1 family beta-glucosidase n=1 Tax=Stackebrandtia sp. TaxID=2023065 RepID=UPI002D37C8CF|nr:GH1 family beta-glucosidase [Stackebrandtia sp.]HZE41520.1 GH1 family beta-glucosidase [Stackebrandtia sp.]